MSSAAALLDCMEGSLSLPALMEDHPLAFARLWDNPLPQTSQRRAFQNMGELVTIICGGNRSGKSTAAAQYVVATALGRHDPDAIAWCTNNGVPLESLPSRPGKVWSVGLDSGDSREYIRPTVAQYLPKGCKWRNRDGFGRAEVVLPNGGQISFLSVDMGRDGFQGSAVDLVHFDEEPADRAVVNEALMRLVDRNGKMLMSLTPLRGMTWLYDRWVSHTPEDTAVHFLHGEDNPHLPPGALDRLLRQYGPHERAARARGEWVAVEGRIYSDWARHLHVVPSFKIPETWATFGCLDFGTRHPTAFLLCALDGSTDTLHIVSEWYAAERTLREHAGRIAAILNAHRPTDWIVADPEDRGSRMSLSRDFGIATIGARKGKGSILSGINAVCERLAPSPIDGRPALVVHDCCPNLIREIEGYVWDDRGKGEQRDQPKPSQSDHCLDALRYCCMQLARSTFGVG